MPSKSTYVAPELTRTIPNGWSDKLDSGVPSPVRTPAGKALKKIMTSPRGQFDLVVPADSDLDWDKLAEMGLGYDELQNRLRQGYGRHYDDTFRNQLAEFGKVTAPWLIPWGRVASGVVRGVRLGARAFAGGRGAMNLGRAGSGAGGTGRGGGGGAGGGGGPADALPDALPPNPNLAYHTEILRDAVLSQETAAFWTGAHRRLVIARQGVQGGIVTAEQEAALVWSFAEHRFMMGPNPVVVPGFAAGSWDWFLVFLGLH